MPNVNGQQFPYTPEGMAQAAKAGGGQPIGPGGPSGGGFNPDQNPFEAILAEGQQEAPIPPQVPIEERPIELQPGKTGDNSKPLLSAIHNLHNYISLSTSDANEIRVVRNLISALTKLISSDQERSVRGENEPPPEPVETPAPATPAATPKPAVTPAPAQ